MVGASRAVLARAVSHCTLLNPQSVPDTQLGAYLESEGLLCMLWKCSVRLQRYRASGCRLVMDACLALSAS